MAEDGDGGSSSSSSSSDESVSIANNDNNNSTAAEASKPTTTTTTVQSDDTPDAPAHASATSTTISLVDGLRILCGLALLSGLLSYFVTGNSVIWGYHAWWTQPQALVAGLRGPVRLTDTQLLRYDGREPSRPIYLALNGTIYDVTSNPRIYGPGGMYSVFSGRDATRGFVTGCFAVDNVADLRGVEWVFIPRDVPTFEEKKDEELSDLMRLYREEWVRGALKEVRDAVGHWQKVFRGETGKEYFEVGSVVGRKKETGPVRELCKQRPKEGFEKWMQNRRVARAQASKEEAKKEKKEEGGAGQVQQKDKVEL